jgi:hypothetical protein
MRHLIVIVVGCLVVAGLSRKANTECINTCACHNCWQQSSGGTYHWRSSGDGYPTCRTMRYPTQHPQTGKTPMVTRKIRRVISSTPICDNWGGINKRTSHEQSCGADLDNEDTNISSYWICLPANSG